MGIGEIGERLRRSTVQIRNGRSSSGSGVIWDASGAVITNDHVAGSGDLTIELWDGRTSRARAGRRDRHRDLAVLRAETDGIEHVQVGDSARLRVGELVIAVGNPFGFTGALSTGIVHGVGAVWGMGGQLFIQSTVRLAPGNSGGPLADASGNVIGINTAIVPGGLGLAVPANAVRRLLTTDPPAELGVTVRPVRIPGANGGIALLVLSVVKGSPADYASVRIGDLLIGAGGKRFTSVDDLREALDRAEGRSLTIQFRRDSPRQREATVQLIQGVAA